MPVWPDALQSLFARAAARLRLLAIANAVSAALIISTPALAARWMGALSTPACIGWALAAVAAAGAVAGWRSPRRPDALAAAIEARTPAARNLFVTAAELLTRAQPIRADVRDVVLRDAADAARQVDVAGLFPGRRAALTLLMIAVAWVGAVLVNGNWVARAREIARESAGAPSIGRIVVTVTPPAYAGRPSQTFTDPDRVDALAGSAIHVDVRASADHVDLIGVGERHALVRGADDAFRGDMTAAADGFLALQPFGSAEAAGVRRVISLAVTPDHAPTARIIAPGKDLFLTAATSTLPVKIEAGDDIGLASLQLMYTKVTGSGENFEFKEGAFTIQITRENPRAWTAAASIPLASLSLVPGDVLVYRAVVGDARPGSVPVESDAFVIEIRRPGESVAEGFAIDEEKDKYALSQQMIIIKTERLIAKKSTMAAEAFGDEAQTIAAEQRKVRAEFVFMMGGEFKDAAASATGDIDETEEAANEAELLAGRMQNNGRLDIILATRRMSGAAQMLTNIDPVQALPHEKAALVALLRAFTRSRYILRVLTPRERIDDARRLSGKMTDVTAWRRAVAEAVDNPRTAALLTSLSSTAGVSALKSYGAGDANALAGIAESILRADGTLSAIAQPFAQAAAGITAGTSAHETAVLVDAATVKLSALVRDALLAATRPAEPSRARLRGALADALNDHGGAGSGGGRRGRGGRQ